MAKKRIALIGAGAIGKMHMDVLERSGAATLSAIADPFAAAKDVADERGVPYFAHFREMLAENKPDGVIIASPNPAHEEAAIACMEAGIPALVEKPIAHTLASARSIVEASARTGVPILVGHHRRHNPILRKARALVDAGTLGVPVSATAMCTWFKPDSYYEMAWRREKGGGPVLINLIHDIDILHYLLGDVVSVQASTSNAVRQFDVEDTAAVLLRFKNGALGTISVSDTAVSPWNWDLCAGEAAHYPRQSQNSHFLTGTQGAITLPGLDIWSYRGTPGWHEELTREHTELHLGNPYDGQLQNLCDVIDGKAEPVCTARDGLRSLRTTLAVHEAASSGSVITLDNQ